MLLTPVDFKADFRIAFSDGSAEEAKIEEIIELYEPKYLRGLFGKVMYDKLVATTLFTPGGVTPTPEQQAVYDPIYYEHGGCAHESDGLKVMLAQLIYLHIAADGMISNTPLGDRVNNSEVSSGIDNTKARVNYNRGRRSYVAIQAYCLSKSDVYTDFVTRDIKLAGY